jgi:hypothetical protein
MTKELDFSGVWKSTQTYTTVNKPGQVLTFSIDMKFYRTGNQLVAQSVPNPENEYVVARLSINGRVLTGTWQHENPSTSEDHANTNYDGAVQLVMSEDGTTMEGQYVGVNRRMQVMANKWVLTRQ